MEYLLLVHLSGKWLFERSISKPQLNIIGTALFEPLSSGRLSYHEYGNYILDGNNYDFFQKRTFVYKNDILIVYKQDDNILHTFNLNTNSTYPMTLTHTHDCGPDSYKSIYNFESESAFETCYEVTGPNKSYTIKTRYSKN
jgi:hypothetical protein